MGELYNPYPRLPKNIRQIGERDEAVKLYLEDYVNTYLRRLYPQGGQDLRVGLLLGSSEMQNGMPYIFIDGAMEMEGVTAEGERVDFTEAAWKQAYQRMEEAFPKRTVQGWFLCGGQGSQLSPLNYWKQHVQYFAGKNQIMYLNSGMDGEEAVFMTSDDGFYRLKGHSIYYERNQMMQDYMILRKDAHRVESGTSDRIIRDFRNKMQDRKLEVLKKQSKVSLLGGACGALSLALLAGGVVMVNNYGRMREMETVLASVLPAGYESFIGEAGTDQVIIEEAAAGISPAAPEHPTEVVEETLVQGGNATAGRDFVTPAPSESAVSESSAGNPAETSAEVPVTAVETEEAETVDPEAPEVYEIEAVETKPSEAPAEAEAEAEETPPAEAVTEANAQGQRLYTIQEGETLHGICYKFYHTINRLDELCEANGIEDVDKIFSGKTLVIPE